MIRIGLKVVMVMEERGLGGRVGCVCVCVLCCVCVCWGGGGDDGGVMQRMQCM